MAADQNKVLLCEQLTRLFLIERRTLRGQKDRMHVLARAQRLVAQIKRLGEHDLTTAAAVGGVVCLVVLVEGIVADVGRLDLDEPLVLRPADNALAHDRVYHLGEQRHDVDFHSIRPSMLST